MMKHALACLCLFLSLTGPALAGSMAEYQTAYQNLLSLHRLTTLDMRTPKKASAAVEKFSKHWARFRNEYGATPPPHLEQAPDWPQTIAQVSQTLMQAQMSAMGGRARQARSQVAGIPDLLGQMHRRNGYLHPADMLTRYRQQLSVVVRLDLDDPDGIGRLREQAAVLAHLAAQMAATVPPARISQAEHDKTMARLVASVSALQSAARRADRSLIASTRKDLFKTYARVVMLY